MFLHRILFAAIAVVSSSLCMEDSYTSLNTVFAVACQTGNAKRVLECLHPNDTFPSDFEIWVHQRLMYDKIYIKQKHINLALANPNVLQVLINEGGLLNVAGGDDKAPLFAVIGKIDWDSRYASERIPYYLQSLQLLLNAGSNPSLATASLDTPLHLLTRLAKGKSKHLSFLTKCKNPMMVEPYDSITDIKVARTLQSKGGIKLCFALNSSKNTPLHYAAALNMVTGLPADLSLNNDQQYNPTTRPFYESVLVNMLMPTGLSQRSACVTCCDPESIQILATEIRDKMTTQEHEMLITTLKQRNAENKTPLDCAKDPHVRKLLETLLELT